MTDIDHKHCQKCRYYEKQFNLNMWYCSYALRNDRLRKRNPETGKCESYEPRSKQKETKEERIERSLRGFIKGEADSVNRRFKE